jgi:hypothetical protein
MFKYGNISQSGVNDFAMGYEHAYTQHDYVSEVTRNPYSKNAVIKDGKFQMSALVNSSKAVNKLSRITDAKVSRVKNAIIPDKASDIMINSISVAGSGASQPIDLLTRVRAEVLEQSYHNEYNNIMSLLDVSVGEGAYMSEWGFPAVFGTGDNFEKGLSKNGGIGSAPTSNVIAELMTHPTMFWEGSLSYNSIEVMQHAQGGFLNMVAQKESQQINQFQIGHSKVICLGDNSGRLNGLLNYADTQISNAIVNDNLSITQSLASMTATQFVQAINNMQKTYYNAIQYVGDAYSSSPNVLLVPLQEYTALKGPLSADFAIAGSSRLQILENMLSTPDKPFKVQPMQYCDKNLNNLGVNRYMLLDNSGRDFKLAMSIPYTSTIYGSVDNFTFNSRQFAQFTGVVITRPKAVYFSFA